MNLIKKAYLRLKYFIISNTLHGTHSPFVYHFLEDVVYQKNIKGEDKYEQLINRIVFSRVNGKVEQFELSKGAEITLSKYHLLKTETDEQSIFVFSNIRKTEQSYNTWKSIIADDANNISIDMFEIGILFFAQKKPKEHFTIYY